MRVKGFTEWRPNFASANIGTGSALHLGREMLLTEPPLRAEHFGRRYRRNRPWAVRDVSFSIPEGAIAALVGPNGAGKSTLIRACLGYEVPDAGHVSVFGADPQKDRKAAVSAIGYIPQGFALYRGLTILDHLTMAEAARPLFDRSFALALIEESRLDGRRKLGELSGGEQSHVALAVALATRAPLLLLDEPLASLDPLARRDFLTAMSTDVRKRQATTLISSHLIADVDQICDWLLVLADGQLALATSMAEARGRFGIAAGDEQDGHVVVGVFADTSGMLLALIDGDGGDRPATLEEIVLGHMAAGRTRRTERSR
jgi:ABC-2 type transport system ATP-binding protein